MKIKNVYKVRILILALFAVTYIIVKCVYIYDQRRMDSLYLSRFDLQLTGKVSENVCFGPDKYLIRIEVDSSNIDIIDDRDTLERYFIVLRNNNAELFVRYVENVKAGDSIVIGNKKVFIYRNHVKLYEKPLTFPTPNLEYGGGGIMLRIKSLHKI